MDVQELIAKGIGVVIDLREEHEWAKPDRYGLDAVSAQLWSGLERFHVPIPDTQAPGPEDLDRLWKILDHYHREDGKGAYIHCRAGRERTGAVLVAYLARSEGITFNDALRRLGEADCPVHLLPGQETAVRRWLGE